MPILIPRTVTPHPFRQLAIHSLSFLRAQARCRHDSAAGESLKAQTELKEDVNQDAPPLRIRKHGFRPLPVSPLMREDGARKHRRDITPQDDNLKEFQKEVALNPYAQALATPIRFCNLTLARLPSHFLLPFTTTIERVPNTTNGNSPKVKARIQPGRSAEYSGETLAQTSYVLNRQDMVRHLSRKRHWTILITDRQKTKLASIAHRNPSAQKLVQDHWVWDEQVDATAAMLERRVVVAVTHMLKSHGQATGSSSSSAEDIAFALKFNHNDAGDLEGEAQVQADGEVYNLTALLSPETLSVLEGELAQDSTDTIYVAKGSEACQAQLALARLKAYKESNEIAKELPQVQNPVGSREARLKKRLELGGRSEDEDESE